MATTSSIITLNFFTNIKVAPKSCLQAFNKISSNMNGKSTSVKLNADRDLKIKLKEAQTVSDNGGLTSLMQSLKVVDEEANMTSPPSETMEHLILAGRMIKGGLVFQQSIYIRSFEIDPDYKLSTKAIMNYLQDASLKMMGMSPGGGWGATPAMCKHDLVWVFRNMQIEVDRYPSWNDIVQLSHWVCTSGRTGVRLEWIINDTKTGETLVRASCSAVIMNKKTRKTCRLPEELKQELKPYLRTDVEPIVSAAANRNITSSPQPVDDSPIDQVRTGLTPGWYDLDFNYHVNNSKYVDWILESTPRSFLYSHELCRIVLEYRKECLKDDVLGSSSKVVAIDSDSECDQGHGRVEFQHVVCLDSGPEVLRASTTWRPKSLTLAQ